MLSARSSKPTISVDKAGIIHASIGRVGFSAEQIEQNATALLNDLKRAKPATSKGVYIKKITLSSTMGPGIAIDPVPHRNN